MCSAIVLCERISCEGNKEKQKNLSLSTYHMTTKRGSKSGNLEHRCAKSTGLSASSLFPCHNTIIARFTGAVRCICNEWGMCARRSSRNSSNTSRKPLTHSPSSRSPDPVPRFARAIRAIYWRDIGGQPCSHSDRYRSAHTQPAAV